MKGVKQMIAPTDKDNQIGFSSNGCPCLGTVSSVNANTNTEGTVVLKNVPIEVIQKLNIGQSVELRL